MEDWVSTEQKCKNYYPKDLDHFSDDEKNNAKIMQTIMHLVMLVLVIMMIWKTTLAIIQQTLEGNLNSNT